MSCKAACADHPPALGLADLADVAKRYGIRLPQSYVHGGVIGVVDVVECKKRTASPWHRRGSIGWVLEASATSRPPAAASGHMFK